MSFSSLARPWKISGQDNVQNLDGNQELCEYLEIIERDGKVWNATKQQASIEQNRLERLIFLCRQHGYHAHFYGILIRFGIPPGLLFQTGGSTMVRDELGQYQGSRYHMWCSKTQRYTQLPVLGYAILHDADPHQWIWKLIQLYEISNFGKVYKLFATYIPWGLARDRTIWVLCEEIMMTGPWSSVPSIHRSSLFLLGFLLRSSPDADRVKRILGICHRYRVNWQKQPNQELMFDPLFVWASLRAYLKQYGINITEKTDVIIINYLIRKDITPIISHKLDKSVLDKAGFKRLCRLQLHYELATKKAKLELARADSIKQALNQAMNSNSD